MIRLNQFLSTRALALPLLLGSLVTFTACDSNDPGTEGATTVEGRVTDEQGYGKTALTAPGAPHQTAASIEGAVVTATEVTASGGTRSLSGQATTNAQGRYTLDVESTSDVLVTTANKGAFQAKALVYKANRTRVNAVPMTSESSAEADVYVRAKSRSSATTTADVAVYVTKKVAADIESGATTVTEVAAAIQASAEAEAEYVEEEAGSDEAEDVQEEENQAYFRFQSSVSASADVSGEATAVQAMEDAVVEAYAKAGVEAETRARALQSASMAVVKFSANTSSRTRVELQKQAALLAAKATTAAVDAKFRAAGASSATLNALASAASTFEAQVRAAVSTSMLAEAKNAYSASVKAELASETSLSISAMDSALAGIGSIKAVLDTTLGLAGSGRAVAKGFITFYANAESALAQSFDSSANAQFAASVLVLLSA